jgi:hypothetical protein
MRTTRGLEILVARQPAENKEEFSNFAITLPEENAL